MKIRLAVGAVALLWLSSCQAAPPHPTPEPGALVTAGPPPVFFPVDASPWTDDRFLQADPDDLVQWLAPGLARRITGVERTPVAGTHNWLVSLSEASRRTGDVCSTAVHRVIVFDSEGVSRTPSNRGQTEILHRAMNPDRSCSTDSPVKGFPAPTPELATRWLRVFEAGQAGPAGRVPPRCEDQAACPPALAELRASGIMQAGPCGSEPRCFSYLVAGAGEGVAPRGWRVELRGRNYDAITIRPERPLLF